jgi:hypothetical protein
MTFEEVALRCVNDKGLVKEFYRLTGHKLGSPRTPIQKAIDDACNYDPDKEAFPDFCKFVFECIWIPLLDIEYKEYSVVH